MFFLLFGLYAAFRFWCGYQRGKARLAVDKAYEVGYAKAGEEHARKRAQFDAYIAEREVRYQTEIKAQADVQRRLRVLNLSSMPQDGRALKTARNTAMLENHPDRGGNPTIAVEINDAYDELARELGLDSITYEGDTDTSWMEGNAA